MKIEEKKEEEKPEQDPKSPEDGKEDAPIQEVASPLKKNKKKIILAGIVLSLFIISGSGVFLYLKKQKIAEEEKKMTQQQSPQNEIIYHDLDEMIVNLNTEGQGVSFLKLKITLEIEGKNNLDTITKFTPKIKDTFQLYLRELRPEDMQGSVGLYRLKEELLLRINKVIYPAYVNDILFKDVLVQ